MTFTHDWFSNNIGNWTHWLAEFKGNPTRALEIGCYEGRATTWLLENILTHPESSITVVDTFQGSEEHRDLGVSFSKVRMTFQENVKQWAKKVHMFEGFSQEVVRHFTGPYDFIYVDGSHKAPDVLTDACMAWPILRKGGVMIFDDYLWNAYPDPTHNPKLGVDAFLSVFAGDYALMGKEYQVCVRKSYCHTLDIREG